MIFKQLLRLSKTFLSNIYFHRRFVAPVLVSLSLTERCNSRCRYCGLWEGAEKELDTQDVISLIQTLGKMGTLGISISGGEPLIRSDIGEIAKALQELPMRSSLSTNGLLVPEKIDVVKRFNQVRISFDGREEHHNLIRGHNSYKAVLHAIDVCQEQNVKFFFNTTLNSLNLSDVKYILDFCLEKQTKVFFQPVTPAVLGSVGQRHEFTPEAEAYRNTIERVIEFKRDKIYSRVIQNSLHSLYYMQNWPCPTYTPCFAGRFFYMIGVTGELYACPRLRKSKIEIDLKRVSPHYLGELAAQLPTESCMECWCNLVEVNYICTGRLKSIASLIIR